MIGNPFEHTMSDIMNKKVVTISSDDTVADAVKKMKANRIGAVVVTDDSKITGIFSERDVVLRVVAEGKDPGAMRMTDVMTKNPKTLHPKTSVFEAFELTQEGKFRHIPIVENDSLVGIVSVRDINRSFYTEKDTLNEMKFKFAMITSHELKTPCSVIKSCMFLLKDANELDRDQKKVINLIDKNVSKLGNIAGNLAKLYSGSLMPFESNMKQSSIEEVIMEVVDDIEPIVKSRNQSLSVEMDKNLAMIMIDQKGIKEVIINLLLNSVRFTQDKGKIVIRVKETDDNLRVEIEDNGIGIPEDKQHRIFESFYEVHDILEHSSGSVEFKSGGMGIGLAIVKNTIDLHHGRIWVESEEGKFSRFIFTIPK